jgi:hypothetical protein
VRTLGKLLDACIWLDDDLMTTNFKLAEHAQLIIFRPVAWKKVGTWKRNLPQCLQRSVTSLYVSTLCLRGPNLLASLEARKLRQQTRHRRPFFELCFTGFILSKLSSASMSI